MKKLSAFLIDDDYPTNVYNEIMLENSGLFDTWSIFTTVSDAINTLITNDQVPDLILLDINMPIMNGWDFLDQYESLDIKHKCECVIMLTTSLSKYDADKIASYKRIRSLKEKPLSLEMLTDIFEMATN